MTQNCWREWSFPCFFQLYNLFGFFEIGTPQLYSCLRKKKLEPSAKVCESLLTNYWMEHISENKLVCLHFLIFVNQNNNCICSMDTLHLTTSLQSIEFDCSMNWNIKARELRIRGGESLRILTLIKLVMHLARRSNNVLH